MQFISHFRDRPAAQRGGAWAIGSFDGVHRGHQAVLWRLSESAARVGQPPCIALRPPSRPMLSTLRQRVRLLASYGVAKVLLLRAGDPDDATVASRLGASVLVSGRHVGPLARCGFELAPPVLAAGVRLDSQGVCADLKAGDLLAVRSALGRDAAVEGRVVHGFHRGASLGIPTANLRVRNLALPPDGVYAVRAHVGDAVLDGVANIGFNPTFGNQVRSIETHLLDFHADLYGRRIEIAFLARLRGERKFAGVEALLEQIRADIAAARTLLQAERHGA